MTPQLFQKLILTWYDQAGRKNLPWQKNKTPYRVWISEIMLQQTQVVTVIPYFQRFMQQFPDVTTLANAHEDSVLHLWAGLGYYSRARNLHRAAKIILTEFQGKFPATLAELCSLPGIGKSTAAAILAIAFKQAAAILDGNVKRVLTRLHAITTPLNSKNTENELWAIAEKYTPHQRIADYTQAMMDFGATLCTRKKPHCVACPVKKNCLAHQQNIAEKLPVKKISAALPTREATFLILKKDQYVLLCKRPSSGIWGGLFSLPQLAGQVEIKAVRELCLHHYPFKIAEYEYLSAFKHTFSHYHLMIYPILITLAKKPWRIMEADRQIWYNLDQPESVGIPKPVQNILRGLV